MACSMLPVRSPLDGLRLEFPAYRIHQRVIGDRLFCLAVATIAWVQPRFAQAQTADRLRAIPTTTPPTSNRQPVSSTPGTRSATPGNGSDPRAPRSPGMGRRTRTTRRLPA
jgi:hypothetical protein